jgi:oxygen-independent coproporphyrinogen III oxidase
MKPRSLYVHVPFCARRCSYCDFAVEPLRDPPVEAWLDAVVGELAMTVAEQGWDEPVRLDTLYVGGGTPSLLGAGAMDALLTRIAPFATLAPDAEWTCEANPESFTAGLAKDWIRAGVNRLSLGAQSFDAGVLRWMGRLHGPDGPERAIAAAREAGFANVSLDLIFGLPARLNRDWATDLERVVALGAEHVSLYGLTAEAGTPLGRWVAEGMEALAGEDAYADDFLLAHRVLGEAGFVHYEVSNFGRPELHSRHNFAYWTGAAYAALGPGAHAYFPPERRWNLRSWDAYRDALAAGRPPIAGRETVDEETLELERIWLGLRTALGFRMERATEGQRRLVAHWADADLARLESGRVTLTPRGWLLLDRLAVDLHEVGSEGGGDRQRAIDGSRRPAHIAANSNPSGDEGRASYRA